MLRIDSHHHLWDERVRPQDWMDDELRTVISGPYDMRDWESAAADAGVSFGVFVQTVADPAETPEVLALAQREPALAGVVGWIDVESATPPGELIDELLGRPGGDRLVGLRVAAEYHPDDRWLVSTSVLGAARALSERGLSLDLLTAARMLGPSAELARSAPETRMVLNHLSKPTMLPEDFADWERGMRDLAASDNVACKLSGFLVFDDEEMTAERLRPYAEVALDAFGPERLMYGSDWPVSVLGGGLARTVDVVQELILGLSFDEQQQVWAGTAQRWYPQLADSTQED